MTLRHFFLITRLYCVGDHLMTLKQLLSPDPLPRLKLPYGAFLETTISLLLVILLSSLFYLGTIFKI